MTQTAEKQSAPRMNQAPFVFNPETDLPKGFYDFLLPLHKEFTPRQQELIRQRAEVLQNAHKGLLPNHLPASEATSGDWRIELPQFARDQRNQMTGPADDAELSVKMLNSNAPGVMLDLEDSMANEWQNLERGLQNVIQALHGDLTYYDYKRDRKVPVNLSETVVFTRARGLHISQANVIPNQLLSASLYDAARVAFGVKPKSLAHPLCFYIPKSESAAEALWWRDLFQTLEKTLGWERGTIKCMALVEAHPLAFQMEEFIFHLREHLIGLNLGRWDYMASLLHFNLQDPQWVLPDRNTIPHDVPFFQNLRELLVEICHKRGILAIGGMTALFPSRVDKELNAHALQVLETDKRNESGVGMDGAWTGHPDQNAIAVAQFLAPNQGFKRHPNAARYPDLRPSLAGVGRRTVDGTRAAIRTVIRYRNGVLCGKGASLLDGYMEDLATDRIYRLMITQRMKHRDTVQILDEQGNAVSHTPAFITRLFDEELAKIKAELPAPLPRDICARYDEARQISEAMILQEQHDPV
jgi:malate synthase